MSAEYAEYDLITMSESDYNALTNWPERPRGNELILVYEWENSGKTEDGSEEDQTGSVIKDSTGGVLIEWQQGRSVNPDQILAHTYRLVATGSLAQELSHLGFLSKYEIRNDDNQ